MMVETLLKNYATGNSQSQIGQEVKQYRVKN